MGLVARTEDIFFGPPMGRSSDCTTMAVVAEINDDADRYLRMIVNGRPLAGSVMQAAENFGVIPLRDGSKQPTVKLLPFDGDAYGVFAYVESVLLVNVAQGNERLSLTQRLMINPMVRSAAADLVATQDAAVSRYTAESVSEVLKPGQHRTATVKAVYHRNLRDDIARISESPKKFILVATQPLQNFPVLGALDATARLIPRDDNDRDVARHRSALGWAFASQAAIAAAIVRKGCESSVDARAAMMVAQRLFRTPTPPAASALRPTGSPPDVKLVPPTPRTAPPR